MKSEFPKALYEICGRPMLGFVVNACRLAGVDRLMVVVGHGKERVLARFASEQEITWVEQLEQKGTGDAVACCRDALKGFSGSILVIAGDMPLVRRETLVDLTETRERSGDALTLATTFLDDPTGYGRIIRDADGRVTVHVETYLLERSGFSVVHGEPGRNYVILVVEFDFRVSPQLDYRALLYGLDNGLRLVTDEESCEGCPERIIVSRIGEECNRNRDQKRHVDG